MPAIAPPESLDEEEVEGAEVDDGDGDEVDVDEMNEDADAEKLKTDDDKPARNCLGSLTIPTPLPQHAVLFFPQHQVSLSARPVQDVMSELPDEPRVCSQMLRQLPDVKLLSVQKFATKLVGMY
jgi:hypothetical protein